MNNLVAPLPWLLTNPSGPGYEWRSAVTDDPKSPVEDSLDDPTKQDSSPDLPTPLTGNDDEDDSEDDDATPGS